MCVNCSGTFMSQARTIQLFYKINQSAVSIRPRQGARQTERTWASYRTRSTTCANCKYKIYIDFCIRIDISCETQCARPKTKIHFPINPTSKVGILANELTHSPYLHRRWLEACQNKTKRNRTAYPPTMYAFPHVSDSFRNERKQMKIPTEGFGECTIRHRRRVLPILRSTSFHWPLNENCSHTIKYIAHNSG